ncbi:hypothetical protein FIBSPDRAFT_899892 [Athelia psychrophila]|uniref:Uncharacterized protein n=1 Tax=Athelia psychrophila TaxID=1759441 RepID=A0A165Z3P3_9AGAM|nr:hypothetical protein FIBSPDRAFT_899892 [Fibularhizoctonia sp. CBS 109695]
MPSTFQPEPVTGPRATITQNDNPSAQVNSGDLSSDDQRPRKRTRGVFEASHNSERKTENAEGQADSKELSDLRAKVKQLEESIKTLRQECTRYRLFWIAECRLKDLMEAGHYNNFISQPRWNASSPERDYDEDVMDACAKELTPELDSEA